MVSVGDPVATGLVDSLARPGRNITGMSRVPTPALMGKTLELLKEAVPGLVTVAVLSKPQNPLHVVLLKGLNPAARSLGLNLKIAEAETANDLQKAFLAMGGGGAGAVFVLIDGMFFINRTRIADLALKERLPSIFGSPEHVQAGGLMSYGSSVADHYRRAATYVDKILKGAKPADLPVEQPTKFDLVINLKTAKALGLTIAPTLLARADEVIE